MIETYLIATMVFLQLADAITTYKGLSKPGIAEGNPFIAKILETIGLKGFLFAKIAFAVILLIYLPGSNLLAVVGVTAVYVYVIWANIKLIRGK